LGYILGNFFTNSSGHPASVIRLHSSFSNFQSISQNSEASAREIVEKKSVAADGAEILFRACQYNLMP
jgi:hypothetical protein